MNNNDQKNDYVRPLDEAAKQLFRNDPNFALKVEGWGYLVAGYFIAACFGLAFAIQAIIKVRAVVKDVVTDVLVNFFGG